MTAVRSGLGERHTDEAALFGAAVAAVVALTLGNGAWQPLSTCFGVVLVAVICAYHKPVTGGVPRRRRLLMAVAAAGVLGLCSVLALSWPLQYTADHTWRTTHCEVIHAAEEEALEEAKPPAKTVPTSENIADAHLGADLAADYSNCQGAATNNMITYAAIVTGGLWLLWTAGLVERRGWCPRWRGRLPRWLPRWLISVARGRRL